MKTKESKKTKKKALTPKAKIEAKVKTKPKAKVSKVSAIKTGPVAKIGIKTAEKKPVIAKAKVEVKVKAKPKAKVSKVSEIKPKPVAKIRIKTAEKKPVIAKAKIEAKAKTKPKAKVSKVSAIKTGPVAKIGIKTAEKKPVTAKAKVETKARIKRTPAADRPKVTGITLMGRISNTPKEERPVPESSSPKISAAGEKPDKENIVTQDAERVPLKSSKARLKIFLPEQNVTKEEAEEIFFGGLPEEYGVNCVIALAVDPNTVFVDWEVIPKDISAMEGDLNLRFYDITGIDFNDWKAHSVFDILINKRVGSGFFDIRMPGCDVVVAVGILNAASGFMPIVRSDMVSFPELLTFDELGIVQKLFESGIPVGY